MSGTAHLHSDIQTYLAGMDRASLQKAVFAALARPGKIVDKGCGSGITAHDLALLFPSSHIVGVDLDPRMIEHANKTYRRPNLSFQVGDAEKQTFEKNSVDAIFFSSILHHLTSYGTGFFDTEHVRTAIQNAVTELSDHGLLILRDFLVPDGPQNCLIDLPTTDGTTALFEKFAIDFRSSQHPQSGVSYEKMPGAPNGFQRFRLSLRDATEFVLRKDYRDSYTAEIKEEYCFYSQSDYERELGQRGMRLLSSTPIRNPWIVKNRFEGKFALWTEEGDRLPYPATNFVIVGQKVPVGEGVEIREAQSTKVERPNFIYLRAMREKTSSYVFDVVGRPHRTIDLLPYFTSDHRLFVLAKQSFPRPIINIPSATPNLSGAHTGGYVVEPLSFIHATDAPVAKAIENELFKRARIKPQSISASHDEAGLEFYPSPGLTDEKVTSFTVRLKDSAFSTVPAENYSGFHSSGQVRAFEADQALRSAQAGGVFDSRLEIAIYFELLAQKRPVGPWVGEALAPISQASVNFSIETAINVLNGKKEKAFEPAPESEAGKYLEIRVGRFEEKDRDGDTVAVAQREYVQPLSFSHNVGSTLPYFVTENGRIFVGLESRELPSVQLHEGTSTITTCPAWRLPRELSDLEAMRTFVKERLALDFLCEALQIAFLGGHYYTSPGVTPECIYPMAVEIKAASGPGKLRWVDLQDVIIQRVHLKEGRLLTHSLRLAHALGLMAL